jgi:hypothetical protein
MTKEQKGAKDAKTIEVVGRSRNAEIRSQEAGRK